MKYLAKYLLSNVENQIQYLYRYNIRLTCDSSHTHVNKHIYKHTYIYIHTHLNIYAYCATYDMKSIPLSPRPRRCAPTASAEALRWQDRGWADLGRVAFKEFRLRVSGSGFRGLGFRV